MKQSKLHISLSRLRKTLLLFLLVFSVAFSPLKAPPAKAWDALFAGETIFGEQQVVDLIKSMVVGVLKQAAIQMVSKQVDRFVSGVGGNGARFITNWQDYLVNAPQRKAKAYANDYISQAFSGRGSSFYQSAGGSVLGASTTADEGFGARVLAAVTDCSVANTGTECVMPDGVTIGTCQPTGGNTMQCSTNNGSSAPTKSYAEEMQAMADKWVINPEPKTFPNIDTEKLLADNNLSNLNLYVLENNMPADVAMYTQAYMDQAEKDAKTEAVAKSTAYSGYIGNGDESGSITRPGSLIKEMQANVENLPNMALTAATGLPEVIAATVSKAISSMVQGAVSGVQRAVDQKLNSVTDKAVNQVNQKVNSFGPGALYKK